MPARALPPSFPPIAPRSPTIRRGRSRSRCAKASTATTRCSAIARARPSVISRPATGARSATSARDRIDYYDRRVLETVERIEREFRSAGPRRQRRRRAVGAGQAPLHRPADRPQAARVRGDVLQFGVVQDPAPHVLPQPLHLRAAGGLHRAHRGRSAHLPQLLPAGSRACAHALIDIVLDFRLETRFADFRRDLAQPAARRSAARAPRPYRLEANHQIQVLSTLFFRDQTAYAVGRVVNGMHDAAVRGRDQAHGRRPALRRRAADGRHRARAPVLRQPLVLPGRHGSAVGVRQFPARDAARQDGVRAVHDGRTAEGTARTSSIATSCTTSRTRATASSSRRASAAS